MAYVLSIIANPENPVIDDDVLGLLRSLCPDSDVKILAPGVACEASIAQTDPDQLGAVRDALKDAPLDLNLLPIEKRRKKLLIADMDSTIIEQECIDELAAYMGKEKEVAAITARAMRGDMEFDAALRARVSLLAGLPVDALEDTYRQRLTVSPGARQLVQTMKHHGAITALVSGGFTFFANRIGEKLGFDFVQANELLIMHGKLSGQVAAPILGRAAKQNALLQYAGQNNIDLEETLAVGDGANDLSMLVRAGLGVAFRAKPAVAESAQARITHGDLTALLYLQGIPQTDFID